MSAETKLADVILHRAGTCYKSEIQILSVARLLRKATDSNISHIMDKLLVVALVTAVFYSCCPPPASAECKTLTASVSEVHSIKLKG